jgi:hypothetical protein
MKDFLIALPFLIVIATGIVFLLDREDQKFQQIAEQSKVYKMPNGVSFFGTEDEAKAYRKWLEKQGQKQ